jgi:hypothetical protein
MVTECHTAVDVEATTLQSLIGSVDAPPDWSAEHDHYLYGTPKRVEPRGAAPADAPPPAQQETDP